MKLTRKVLALVLVLTMVLGFATTASAAEHEHTITIHWSETGYTYVAYQIFDGDLNKEGVLSNIDWGNGVNGAALLAELKTLPEFASCNSAEDVAVVLSGAGAMDDPLAKKFADVAAKHVTTGTSSSYDATNKWYTISPLEDGYYIVINTVAPTDKPDTVVSRYILEVVRNISVAHKGEVPTVTKDIITPELRLKENQQPIGGVETYEITGTMPTTVADYVTYYYAFHDTLSKGLTYNEDSLKVTVNGVDVTKYFYTEVSAYDETTGTKIYVGIEDILALALVEDVDSVTPGNQTTGPITKDTKVILTYTATVNTNAVIAGEGNPNEVYLEYDRDPNTEGVPTPPNPTPDKPTPPHPTGETPVSRVTTYTTELTILKKDGAGNALTGAEFTLEGTAVRTLIITRDTFAPAEADETATHYELKDGQFTTTAPVFVDDPATTDIDERTYEYYVNPGTAEFPVGPTHLIKEVVEYQEQTESVKVKAFVGEDGYLTFTGLGAGKYTLTESVTPAGFNTIDPIEFEVTFDYTTHKFHCDNSWIMVEADNTLYAEIINVAGSTLPSTGGIGTTLFYIFGGMMFAGAAILLVTKKRMAA